MTKTEAKYRAKRPGSFTLNVEGYGQKYSVKVNSSYVPVESIKPAISGTVKVLPAKYASDGSQYNVGTVINKKNAFNDAVVVTPSNASYAYNWTMVSSDNSVVDYTTDNGGAKGIVPYKAGVATLTVTSEDPGLKTQVFGSANIKIVYDDSVAVSAFGDLMNDLPKASDITLKNEAAVKDARFVYDNLSEENKDAVGTEMVKELTACEKTIAQIKNPAKPGTTKKAVISLNYKELPVAVKQSTTAVTIKKATVKGDSIKSAKSSNSKVASVSVKNGKLTVKGLKAGTVKVTVTSKKGATATFTVKVQKKSVAVKKLTATVKTKCTVKKGAKATLKVAKTPVTATGTVKWTSSDKKVVTVSSKGVIIARRKGTATVTAKVGTKAVKFKVTVK